MACKKFCKVFVAFSFPKWNERHLKLTFKIKPNWFPSRMVKFSSEWMGHFKQSLWFFDILFLIFPDIEWEFWATWSVIIVKFWLSILFFAINLQSMETYPTCLRQTGMSVGTIAANVIGIFGPYIVYLVSKFLRIIQIEEFHKISHCFGA